MVESVHRRRFAFALGGVLVALAAERSPPVSRAMAQTPGRTYRLGILRPTAGPPSPRTTIDAALAELGYVEGRNLVIDRRYAGGRLERLPAMARELVALGPDAIVAVGSQAVRAAMEATASVPIVMFGNFDPVALGLVANLARPDGNVTGVLIAAEGTFAAKKLELLKEVVPRAARVGMLSHEDPGFRAQEQEVRRAAASLGIELVVAEVRGGDYERAFANLSSARVGALFVGANTFFMVERRRIVDLAAKHRLPAIYEWPEQVEDGGLMAYGGDLRAAYGRVAAQVVRIFNGTRPSDLPVEQPTEVRLVINLRTAQALGLTIPQTLLLRADRVIE